MLDKSHGHSTCGQILVNSIKGVQGTGPARALYLHITTLLQHTLLDSSQIKYQVTRNLASLPPSLHIYDIALRQSVTEEVTEGEPSGVQFRIPNINTIITRQYISTSWGNPKCISLQDICQ